MRDFLSDNCLDKILTLGAGVGAVSFGMGMSAAAPLLVAGFTV
jgi:hypothetical protein